MQIKNKILWVTRTGMLLALLVTLQWATASLGQLVTGSSVNAVLAVAALTVGLPGGLMVALLSPFFAFLLGIGPKLVQIIPLIALGNGVLVLCVHILLGRKPVSWPRKALGIAISAIAKFAVLYVAVVQVLIPLMGAALPQKQAAMFTAMFSWPQLLTALCGTLAAVMLQPLLRRILHK